MESISSNPNTNANGVCAYLSDAATLGCLQDRMDPEVARAYYIDQKPYRIPSLCRMIAEPLRTRPRSPPPSPEFLQRRSLYKMAADPYGLRRGYPPLWAGLQLQSMFRTTADPSEARHRDPPPNSTGFFKLPFEFRMQVYRMALRPISGGNDFCTEDHRKRLCRCRSKPFTPGILTTCRKMSEEAHTVLFDKFYFHFRHPQAMFEFAHIIGQGNCRRLRAIWLSNVLKSLFFDNVPGTFEAWKDALERTTSFCAIDIICLEEQLSSMTGITTALPSSLIAILRDVFGRRCSLRASMVQDGWLLLENVAVPNVYKHTLVLQYEAVGVTPLMVVSRRQVENHIGRALRV
jgi:hypothetical protein